MVCSLPVPWPNPNTDCVDHMRHQLFTVVHLLMLAAASYFGVGLFYQFLRADLNFSLPPAAPVQAAADAPLTASPRPLNDYRIITERNLFRTADVSRTQNAPKAVDLAALQETQLDLKLWGTLVLDPGGRSYAVIEDKKAGGQHLYQVGDKVQEALVKMILRERVVLDVGGKDEILQIEQFDAAANSGRGQAAAVSERPAAPEPEIATRDVALDRQAVESAAGNVGELLKQVRIRPFFQGGKPAGLSLAGITPGSIFEQMGIRNGDVLQAVDGQPIQAVDDVVNFYQGLNSAGEIVIQVRRGGRIEEIRYHID